MTSAYGKAYDACVARRQWQNAANIRGCSIEKVRQEHGEASRSATASNVSQGPIIHSPVPHLSGSAPKTHDPQHNNGNEPADQVWARTIRSDLRKVGLTLKDLARATGYCIETVSVATQPKGATRTAALVAAVEKAMVKIGARRAAK